MKADEYKTPKELIAAVKAAKAKTAFPSTKAMDIDSKLPSNDPSSISTNPIPPDALPTISVPPDSIAHTTAASVSSSGPLPIADNAAPKKRPPVQRPAPTANLFIPKKVQSCSLSPISFADYSASATSPLWRLCSGPQASGTQPASIIILWSHVSCFLLHICFLGTLLISVGRSLAPLFLYILPVDTSMVCTIEDTKHVYMGSSRRPLYSTEFGLCFIDHKTLRSALPKQIGFDFLTIRVHHLTPVLAHSSDKRPQCLVSCVTRLHEVALGHISKLQHSSCCMVNNLQHLRDPMAETSEVAD